MIVSFFGSIQENTNGDESIELSGADRIRALADLLGERYGEGFKHFLLDGHNCIFLVNGSSVVLAGGLDAPLRDSDAVEILPFVDGG